MARQRPSRKEAKQPDPFIISSAVAINWVRNHTRHILYGLLGVVVIIGLVIGWSSWQKQRSQRAAVRLYEALALLETTDEVTRESNTNQAMEQLRAITRDYGRTPAAAQAHWRLGNLHFASGDYTAALAAYEQAQRRLSKQHQLSSVLVTLDIAYAHEASEACDKALADYEKVQQSTAGWLYGEAYLGMGRCHEHTGATDEAIAVYDRALADVQVTGTVRQTVNERVTRLRPAEETPTELPQPPEASSPATSAPEIPPTEKQEPADATPPAAQPVDP